MIDTPTTLAPPQGGTDARSVSPTEGRMNPPPASATGGGGGGQGKPRQSSRNMRRRESSGAGVVLAAPGVGAAGLTREYMSPSFLARMSPNLTLPPPPSRPSSVATTPSLSPSSLTASPTPLPAPVRGSHFLPPQVQLPTRYAQPVVAAKREREMRGMGMGERERERFENPTLPVAAARRAGSPLPPVPGVGGGGRSGRSVSQPQPQSTQRDQQAGKPTTATGAPGPSGARLISPPPPPFLPPDVPLPPIPTRMKSYPQPSAPLPIPSTQPTRTGERPPVARSSSGSGSKEPLGGGSGRQVGQVGLGLGLGPVESRIGEGDRMRQASAPAAMMKPTSGASGSGTRHLEPFIQPQQRTRSPSPQPPQQQQQPIPIPTAPGASSWSEQRMRAGSPHSLGARSAGTQGSPAGSPALEPPTSAGSQTGSWKPLAAAQQQPNGSPPRAARSSSEMRRGKPPPPPLHLQNVGPSSFKPDGRRMSVVQTEEEPVVRPQQQQQGGGRKLSYGPSEFGAQEPTGAGRRSVDALRAPTVQQQQSGLGNSWPNASGKKGSPNINDREPDYSRRSVDDTLRPSVKWGEGMGNAKDDKAATAAGGGGGTMKPVPAVQGRKSSGGLRGLFTRSKGKEKEKVPDLPVPVVLAPPIPVPKRRASEDLLRTTRGMFTSPKERERERERSKTPEPVLTLSPDMTTMSGSSAHTTSEDRHSAVITQATLHAVPATAHDSPRGLPNSESGEGDFLHRSHSAESRFDQVRPSPSLHLLELPQFDLTLGTTFDDFANFGFKRSSQVFKAPPSPEKGTAGKKSGMAGTRRRSRSFGDYASSAAVSGLKDKETSVTDTATVLSQQPSLPALSSSDHHARTFSGASSSMVDSSPPRTPGSSEQSVTPAAHDGVGMTNGSNNSLTLPDPVPPVPYSAQIKTAEIVKTEKGRVAMAGRQLLLDTNLSTAASTSKDTSRSASPNTAKAALEPALEIKTTPKPSAPVATPEMASRPLVLLSKSKLVRSKISQLALAEEMRRLLAMFRIAPSMKTTDKASIIRGQLLDLLVEGEKRGFDAADQAGNMAVRGACMDWANTLLHDLRVDQAANERGACLEALSAVIESTTLSVRALGLDQGVFRALMVKVMNYVNSKLTQKGIYQNVLVFAGRMLAFAFFRIEGVAPQLLLSLPCKPAAWTRFTYFAKTATPASRTSRAAIKYPAYLKPYCFDNARAYNTRLNAYEVRYGTPEEKEAFHFPLNGNMYRRFSSDDSGLFASFYRSYHRQLANLLAPAIAESDSCEKPIPIETLLQAPGYAHLAFIFSQKAVRYINNSVNAVTTSSSSISTTTDEGAVIRGSKPAILETANQRLTETILSLADSKHYIELGGGLVAECDGTQLWTSMLDVWIKNLISRTSLYSPKSVFCLFDLIDGVVQYAEAPVSPSTGNLPSQIPQTVLDIPFLISIVRLILTTTDHHILLTRTIAWIFSSYDVLCAKVEDREALCIKLLLDPTIFQRLCLFWSQSVRSYVLRLMVFRLGHVRLTVTDGANHEMETATVQLLNRRLESVRRRHDELEPKTKLRQVEEVDERGLQSGADDSAMTRSKSTITMVGKQAQGHYSPATKAEKLLGLAPASPNPGGDDAERPEVMNAGALGKATTWLKKSFGKQKKRKTSGSGQESDSEGGSDYSTPRASISSERGSRPSIDQSNGSFSAPKAAPSKRSPTLQSDEFPGLSPESDSSFEGDVSALQPKAFALPVISTTPPVLSTSENKAREARPKTPTQASQFSFEFELPTASPRSDTFDLRPTPSSPSSPGPSPTPPRLPASPHMSRSFSRRSSLLHPIASNIIDGPASPSYRRSIQYTPEPPGYDRKLHPYAIRMLSELELCLEEYKEWYSEGGMGSMDPANAPRLNVAWPWNDEED